MDYRVLSLLFGLTISVAQAQLQKKPAPDPILVTRLSGTIQIDGISNEEAWKATTPVQLFVLEPIYGAEPSEKSELLITYDDKYLYVAARFYYRDSSTIIARNFVRDGWRGDDWFAFDVDSRNDKQNALRFALYPFGTHYDMAISNDAVELGNSTINTNYNMIWEGKCALTKEGWFMEIKIPFAALRFKPRGSQTIMNISATRQSYHNNEKQHFPMIPQTAVNGDKKASLKQPFLFENLKPSKLLYITPSLSTGLMRTNKWDNQKNDFSLISESQVKPSLDVKYSLSSQLIADLTVNTDFSNAEVDDQQFNLSRFSLFFPEKRLFFQEQAGLFEFRLGSQSQLFYSRQIGLKDGSIIPIVAGTRLTGNTSKMDFGMMNIQTAATTINDSVHAHAENFSIIRMRNKVWNQSSYLGAMFTSRINRHSTNLTAGADAVIKIKGDQYFLGTVATSYDKSGKTSIINSGRASLALDLRRRDRFFYTFQYTYSGKSFNPGIGFVDRSNFHNLTTVLSYGRFASQRKGWFRYKKISWKNDSYWSTVRGNFESFLSDVGLLGTSFRDHSFDLHIRYNNESLNDTLFFAHKVYVPEGRHSFVQGSIAYEAPNYLRIRFPFSISYGSFYDGTRTSFSAGPSWSINKYFELQSKYTLEYLHFDSRHTDLVIHLANLNLNWAFNLHLSGQFRGQYNSGIDKILANGRVRYHFSDGNDLYFVYNQTYFTDHFKYTPPHPSFEQQEILIKYVYTFH